MPVIRPKIPPATDRDFSSVSWQRFFHDLGALTTQTGVIGWSRLNFVGSNLSDLATRDHKDLQNVQGGTTNQYYHLTSAEYTNAQAVPSTYVPYSGSTTGTDLNNQYLVNIKHVSIGSSVEPDILLRVFGDNGTYSRFSMRGYSNDAASSSIRVTKFRGTYGAPAVPQSGDSLGIYTFAGYSGLIADGIPGASIEAVTTETWTSTKTGTKLLIKVTNTGTTGPVTAITINADGTVTFAGQVTANITGNTSGTAGSLANVAVGSSGITMATGKLLGRSTAGTGAIEEISIGTGLSLSAGTLSANSVLTAGTKIDTTSGTSKDFTSIPAGIKVIYLNFSGVSTNGTSHLLVQLGTGGTPKSTGYTGSSAAVGAGDVGSAYTTGFGVYAGSAAISFSGSLTFTLLDASTNTWSCSGNLGRGDGILALTAGVVALSGTLDMVRLTTVNGTDAFDAGAINILYG